jgi:hypothetical protein
LFIGIAVSDWFIGVQEDDILRQQISLNGTEKWEQPNWCFSFNCSSMV